MAFKKIILLLSVIFVIRLSQCERLHEQIYSSIEGGAPCYQRLNGTHQTGCTSPMNGAVGVVEMINDISDTAWLVNNATAGPYMAVVNTSMFLDVIDLFLLTPDNIAGILVYQNGSTRPKTFSQESTCPNEGSSDPASQCPSSSGMSWNMGGTGILRKNIPFPIFYLPETRIEEIDKINNCYQRQYTRLITHPEEGPPMGSKLSVPTPNVITYNLDRENQNGKPLCSIQLKSFMFAAVNSEVCLRRSTTSALLTPTKVCDPLGDQNVYFSLFPRGKGVEVKNKPITLVTARIDTASLFDGLAPGAASSVVGMVTLLLSAVTLTKMMPVSDSNLYDSNVVWNLFNGEAFDYIGSQRVAYEMKFGAWPMFAPMDSTDVKLHVELGQIGGSLNLYSENASWPLYAYAADSYTPVTEFLDEMLTNAKQFNMTLLPVFTKNIPPSSLHSFRRILKNETESGQLPQVLLVDYKDTFTNAYYESVFDDADNIGFVYRNISVGPDGLFVPTSVLLSNGSMKEWDVQVKISRLATALALTLYQRVAGKPYAGDVAASAHMADEMLYCFLRSQACRLLAAADYAAGGGGGAGAAPSASASLYVGVAGSPSTPPVFAGHLLALLAGARLPANKTACDAFYKPGFSYYWLRGWNKTGACMQTTMNFTQAVSPAFLIQDYDMSSGLYSTWTESVWAAMWARVFVRGGGGGARAAALAGAATTLAAALLTYWLAKHADTLFKHTDNIPNDAASGILRTVNC